MSETCITVIYTAKETTFKNIIDYLCIQQYSNFWYILGNHLIDISK